LCSPTCVVSPDVTLLRISSFLCHDACMAAH
jgi:hypothetical protein